MELEDIPVLPVEVNEMYEEIDQDDRVTYLGNNNNNVESPRRKRRRVRESDGSSRGQSSSQINNGLSWQERVNTMTERIRHSFMNSELSDITFLVGPEKVAIPAHKTLLSFCSPVFQAQFTGPLSNAQSSTVEITDIDSDTFINFLSFLYLDEIKETEGNVSGVKEYLDLMYPAKKYLVPALSRMCTEELMDRLTPENVFQVYENAVLYDELKLKKCCSRYMDRMCGKIIQTTEFLNLDAPMLSVFLASDGLSAPESQIHRAVLRWAKAKLEREGIEEHTDELIRETLGPLLYLIRFPSMTPKEFGQEEKVSVLLKDEIIQLYRQICCGESPENHLFPPVKRSVDLKCYIVNRFPLNSIEPHEIFIGRERAYSFQIEFKTDRKIFLDGVSLFSITRTVLHPGCNDKLSFDVDFSVIVEDMPRRVTKLLEVNGDLVDTSPNAANTTTSPNNNANVPAARSSPGQARPSSSSPVGQYFKIFLDEALEIPAKKSVNIFIEVTKTELKRTGLKTYFGRTGAFEVPRDYEVTVDCAEDDRSVTFQFGNRINTELGVYSHGQIPGILFSL